MWLNQFLTLAIILLTTSAQEFIFPTEIVPPPCEFISTFLNETLKIQKYKDVDFVLSPGSLIYSLLPVIDLTHQYRDRFEFLGSLSTGNLKPYEINDFLHTYGMEYTNNWYYDGKIKFKVDRQFNRTIFPRETLREFHLNPDIQLSASLVDKEDLNPVKNDAEAVKEYVKDAELIIVGTATFKAPWKYPFDRKYSLHTHESIVAVEDDSLKPASDEVYISGTFNISKGVLKKNGIQAEWIELPFKVADPNRELSMYIFKFDNESSEKLKNTIANMNFKELFVKKQKIVDVTLPQFKINKSINLRPILEKMGLEKMFAKTKDNIYVDKFLQVTTFEISQFGAGTVDHFDTNIQDHSNGWKRPPTTQSQSEDCFHVIAKASIAYAVVDKSSGMPLLYGYLKKLV